MELFRLLGTVAIDNLNAIAGLDETTKKAKVTSEKMAASFKAIGDKSVQLGQKLGLVSAGAGAALGGMVKYASDTEEATNKVNVAFGKSSKVVEKFANTSLKQFGIAKGSAMDMAALFGDMGTSMGLSQKEAAKMSTSLVGLAGDLASFKNIGIDQATTALNGIFTGETESLKTLGIVMTQTNLDAYALANGFGKTTSEMTQSELVALRYAYVMDMTKNAHGDFARTSDGTANSLRVFKESLKELSANFGEVMLPYVSKAVGVMNKFVQAISKAPAPVKLLVVGFMGLLAVASPVLIIFGQMMIGVGNVITVFNKLSPALKTASNNIKTFSSSALASTAATVRDTAAKGVNAVATSKVGTAASSSAKKVLMFASAHKVAMIAALGLAAPIIALAGYMLTTGASAEETAAMITAFADKLSLMITQFANQLPAMIDAIMPAITQTVNAIVAAIPALIPVLIQAGIKLFMALVNSLNEIIPPLVAALPKIVQAVVQALPVLIPALIKAGVTLFTALVKAIPKVVKVLIKSLPQIVKAIKTGLADGCKKVWDLIEKAASEKWEEIKEKITEPIEAAKEFVSKKVQQIKDAFDFSRLVSSVKTVWNNVKDNITNAIEKARDLVDSKVGSIKKYLSFSGLASTVKSIWNDIKTKITDPINSARDFVSDKVSSIKKYLSFSGLVSTVKKEWNDIKEKITDPITSAKDKISDIISKIKKKFPFNIGKIFNLKLPTIGVVWSKTSGLLNKAGIKKLPSLKVTWHAKGAIFDQPTIFATPQGLQGVGEAGAEAVTPIDKLQDYVSTAVASQNSELVAVLNEILEAIKTMDAGVYDKIENALDNRKIQWNDRELGRFVKNYA